MTPSVVIGIDPGKKTGYAEWDIYRGEFNLITTMTFWGAFNYLRRQWHSPHEAHIVIEVPTTKHVWVGGSATGKAKERTAVNVGGVIREAELLAEGLRVAGYTVTEVPPRGKVDANKFRTFTGYQGVTNQHERDAALMAMSYGRRFDAI